VFSIGIEEVRPLGVVFDDERFAWVIRLFRHLAMVAMVPDIAVCFCWA